MNGLYVCAQPVNAGCEYIVNQQQPSYANFFGSTQSGMEPQPPTPQGLLKVNSTKLTQNLHT